jgi:hypothetical protein
MNETTITFIAQSPTAAQQQSPVPALPPTSTGVDWTAVLIPLLPAVFTGVITGLIAPIIAPYTKWHLEKERNKYESRKKRIQDWRNFLSDDSNDIDDWLSHAEFCSIERQFSKTLQEELFDAIEWHRHMLLNHVDDILEGHKNEDEEYMLSLSTEEMLEFYAGEAKKPIVNKMMNKSQSDRKLIKKLILKGLAEIEAKWGLL